LIIDLKKKPVQREVNQEMMIRMREEELKNNEKLHKNLYTE